MADETTMGGAETAVAGDGVGMESGGDGVAESRPDYLVGDYRDAEAQARAYHQLHQQYEGRHTDYANYGKNMWSRYSSDPAFKAAVDRAWLAQQNQQQQEQQQEDIWFKQGDPTSQQQWWDNVFDRPQEYFAKIHKHYNSETQREIAGLKQQLQQLIAHQQSQARLARYSKQTSEMQADPYGKMLLQKVSQNRMTIEDAVELFGHNRPQAAPDEGGGDGRVRGTDGRFARSQPNGRRNGAKADAIPADVQAILNRVFPNRPTSKKS